MFEIYQTNEYHNQQYVMLCRKKNIKDYLYATSDNLEALDNTIKQLVQYFLDNHIAL